jgi:hypothetical protein
MTHPNRLDAGLEAIRSGQDLFLLCDARDPDMARGIAALGVVRGLDGGRRPATRQEFLATVRAVIAQDIVDLMLLSPQNLHRLTVAEDAFSDSHMSRAVRANDTTEIWLGRHAAYRQQPSHPFRNADLARVLARNGDGQVRGADLGLYSITMVNDLAADLRTLEAYRAFRTEANALGFRHFLEVFNPNAGRWTTDEAAAFVNDTVVRLLAGIDAEAAPRFLKVAYNGRRWLSELVGYDSELIVGVLGGAAGTTRDTLELLEQARACGARLALFGRKIAQAEDPLALITVLRAVADRKLTAAQGVDAYHAALADAGLQPDRRLADDSRITDPVLMG